ncbi:DUF427 domain-containing protein [Streptomyces sp. NPDC002057]|uniref:DUF427 domain-containing protein n=1 Tax=Streptomyces sp. NPDC002057 TaxID=3154664 RepID=UPI00331B19C2
MERDDRRLSVRVGSVVVAATTTAFRLLETSHPPVFYFPPSDVRMEFLRPNAARTVCEWKGVAGYWDVVVGSSVVVSAAWSYERPLGAYEALRGHVAFYPSKVLCSVDGVAVESQEGDFYGGWITDEITGPFKGGPGSWGW